MNIMQTAVDKKYEFHLKGGSVILAFDPEETNLVEFVLGTLMKVADPDEAAQLANAYNTIRVSHTPQELN